MNLLKSSQFLILFLSVAPILRAETIVTVPAGVYDLADFVTLSGTSEDWIRYVPEAGAEVTVRGDRGGQLSNVQYVILDGFLVDGTLDEKYPERLYGLQISETATHVRIENVEISGAGDFHTGFDATDTENCSESTGFPTTWSVGLATRGQDVQIIRSVVHGFYDGVSLNGTATLRNSLVRNNFNAVSITGDSVVLEGNVIWVNPNHGLESSGAGVIEVRNNLVVDAQEMFQVWSSGTGRLSLWDNTFHIPANKPCFGFKGIHPRYISEQLTVRNNILVNKRAYWLGVTDALIPNFSSDFNLFFHHELQADAWRDEFVLYDRSPSEVLFDAWFLATGQDGSSLLLQEPLFEAAPQYEDYSANIWGFAIPGSVAEARSWFRLQPGSPGAGAAQDGSDMGIRFLAKPEPVQGVQVR